jgi:hypothetical protein
MAMFLTNRLPTPADHDVRSEMYSASAILARQAPVLEKLPIQPGESSKQPTNAFQPFFFFCPRTYTVNYKQNNPLGSEDYLSL